MSLLLTVPNADTDGAWGHESWGVPSLVKVHTVKAAYDGFLVIPLFYDKLYVSVFFRDGLEVVEEEGAGVGRARPFVAVFENDFSTLGDEHRMTVGLV